MDKRVELIKDLVDTVKEKSSVNKTIIGSNAGSSADKKSKKKKKSLLDLDEEP